MMDFYVDVETGAGVRLGPGPLASVADWQYTARMDRAGSFSCTVAATDPVAAFVTVKCVLRAWANLNGVWTEVGAGIVETIARQVADDGTVALRISGDDLTTELSYRSVGALSLSSGAATTHSAAVTAVAALAPAGWTITPDSAPPWDSIYGRFNGESVLAALIQVADKTRTHFARGSGRTLTFGATFAPSGLRAAQPGLLDLGAETCAIVDLSLTQEARTLLTRIYPRGSGNGDVQLTLRNTTRAAPAGYTLNKTLNFLQHNAGNAAYGRIEAWLDYREIGPVANTDADLEAASNMLFDATLRELAQRNDEAAAVYYDVTLAQCAALLRPLQTIRLVYDDRDSGISVDQELNILEATWRVSASGVQTTGIVVTTVDRWPTTDVDTIVGSMTQGRTYQALPQLNANSYVTSYVKNVDSAQTATFRFRFGAEVVQLQQVLFEFQLLPFESTVTAVGGATSGSAAVDTSTPSSNATGETANNQTGAGGSGNTGSGGDGDSGDATPTIGSTTPAIGSTTPTIGSATPTIGSTTPTIGSTSLTASSTGLATNAPTGGDIVASGRHEHTFSVTLGAASVTYPIGYGASGTSGGLVSTLAGGTHNYPVSQSGNHTHGIDNHTHSITGHTHTIAAHTHTADAHGHTIAAHTHTIAAHTHTIAAHTHTITSHTHTLPAHTHDLSNHTHSLNNHTHNLAESLSAVYGIFRESAVLTYTIDELEYRVNGGSWANLDTATNAGNGWYVLDITSQVINVTTLRPLQGNNTLEVRAKATRVTIASWSSGAFGTNIVRVTCSTAHGRAVGERVVIANAPVYAPLSYAPNGVCYVTNIFSATVVDVERYGAPAGAGASGGSGTLSLQHTATLDAQLSVRNVIQAIAYV